MTFVSFIQPYLAGLNLKLSETCLQGIEQLCQRMLADPLYSSVSKIKEPEDVALKHILDSLAPCGLSLPIWGSAKKILDLGTGGGFPSLPLAILFPEKKVWAVDSKGKAVDFVDRMKNQHHLTNVHPLLGRAEELGHLPDFREKFDLVVSRAVASVRILLEFCLPLARVGGSILLYKGPKLDEEMAEAANALKTLGVTPGDVQLRLIEPPVLPFSRGYVIIHKVRPVGSKYPRANGVPASQPL